MIYRSSSGVDIALAITFHYQKEELVRAVHMKHNTPGKAVCYEIRDYGAYFIIKAIVEVEEKILMVKHNQGTFGMDLNINHMVVSEVDGNGNLVDIHTYRYHLKGKTTNQRKAILRDVVKQIGTDIKRKGKPLIIERLSFETKKSNMLYQKASINEMLSQFAYEQIKTMLYSRMRKDEVKIEEVSPYLTSQIGRAKYNKRMGMNTHMNASYVIARRGMELRERIPKELRQYTNNNTTCLSKWRELLKKCK